MRLLSDASEYALRAVVWLAGRPNEPATTQQIAEATRSAPGYLSRVLQNLGKAGILHAQRGFGGGFTLALEPGDVAVLDVINAVDPIERIRTCPLGLKTHGENLCPLHRRIDNAMAQIEKAFEETTIAEILADPASIKPLCEVTIRAT